MCSIAGVRERLHKISGQTGSNSGFNGNRNHPLTYNGENDVHLFSVDFDPILFILAGNEDMHNVTDEFEFRPDRTTDYRVSCLHASSFIFDRIIIKVAGYQDWHKSLNEFDQTTLFGVTCS